MAMTYTPTVGTTYDFLQDQCDMLTGVVPTTFAASYTDQELTMFEGTIVLINEPKGVQFSLSCSFADGLTVRAVNKLTALNALRGTIGTLIKDNVSLSGVMLKTVSIQSRTSVLLPYVSVGTNSEMIRVSLGFHKVD